MALIATDCLPHQVTALRAALQNSIAESREGIQRTSCLRRATTERCVAHEERLQREREWLRMSMERLAQQRASQARLYVDMSTEMEAQARCEVAAQHDAQLCAAARATLVPLGEALRQEKAALTAAAERERQLSGHAAHLDEVRDGLPTMAPSKAPRWRSADGLADCALIAR